MTALVACVVCSAVGQGLAALDQDEARHLIARTCLAPTPGLIQQIQDLDRAAAVEALLVVQRSEVSYLAEPSWGQVSLAARRAAEDAEQAAWRELSDPEARRKARQKRDRRWWREGRELKQWWYAELVQTPRPLLEKMVVFWHNHFTSELRVVREPYFMLEQNRLLRKHALGNFADLLRAIPVDPAMFVYLDSNSNVKGKPNENFAREVMELFTFGEGVGYTEKDIQEAARAFTGYRIDLETGRPHQNAKDLRYHDYGVKRVLGHRGQFTGDGIITTLLRQEERVAVYITLKMWYEFIHPKPQAKDKRTILRVAKAFYRSGYDISTLLQELLTTDQFWAAENRGTLVKNPVEFQVGLIRQLQLPINNYQELVENGRSMGMDLFDPLGVKGWRGGLAWLNTQSLLARDTTARALLSRSSASAQRRQAMLFAPRDGHLAFSTQAIRWASEVRQGDPAQPAAALQVLVGTDPIQDVDALRGEAWIEAVITDPRYQLK